MAANDNGAQVAETEKKKRHRSPNYPTVGLKEAIERVRRFVGTDGRAGAAANIAAKHIGFASAHGQAYSVLSALKKFGLLEDKDGRVAPTQRALEIVNLPDGDERRRRAIRQAALSPSVYLELINEYRSTGLPSDETLRGELVTYKSFNPNSVGEFLKTFRETLEYAGLTDFSALDLGGSGDQSQRKIGIGSYVQWISQGSDQFHEAKKVVGFSEDGQYAFVEGEKTGLPTAELEIGEAPTPVFGSLPPRSAPRRQLAREDSQLRQDVFSLDNGGEVTISWPVPLTREMVQDIKDWLKIVERKISRSSVPSSADTPEEPA